MANRPIDVVRLDVSNNENGIIVWKFVIIFGGKLNEINFNERPTTQSTE